MELRLAIENVTNLPDGGPISVTVAGKRGIDIGRDSHLDWTLPDPNRFISGKHCEIRYEAGGYILYDMSANGTFLNDAPSRMREPHRLRDGDRLLIGHYIIAVTLDEQNENSRPNSEAAATSPIKADIWETEEPPPPPLDPRDLKAAPERPIAPDFLDWAIDAFDPLGDEAKARNATPAWRANEDASWLPPPAPVHTPEPPPPIPNPRRPVWHVDESKVAAKPERRAAEPISQAPSLAVASTDEPVDTNDPSLIGARFLSRFAQAAGLPVEAVAKKDPEQLAELLGGLMKIVAEDVKQLLQARLEARRLARSGHLTMIEAADNNPLKFSPTSEDALRLMFGAPTPSYLDAAAALRQSFDDLKRHQVDTLAAMQGAVKMLVEDLDPKAIERAVEPDRGVAALIGSRKARLWDAYVARWRAKAHRHDDGLLGAFMFYFPQCYDRNHKS